MIPLPQSQIDIIETLEKYLELAKNNKLIGLIICGSLISEKWKTDYCGNVNIFEAGGIMMSTALRRMGFIDNVVFNNQYKNNKE